MRSAIDVEELFKRAPRTYPEVLGLVLDDVDQIPREPACYVVLGFHRDAAGALPTPQTPRRDGHAGSRRHGSSRGDRGRSSGASEWDRAQLAFRIRERRPPYLAVR